MVSRPAKRNGRFLVRTSAFLGASFALFASFASFAHAQGNAYAAPIGGRSALMGNTGIALGVDGAAPFLNPATIVRLDEQRFAFSVNFYDFSLSHFNSWHQPGTVDASQFGKVALTGTSLTSSGFGGLPSTLCLFFTLAQGSPDKAELANLDTWRQKLAICIGTTEAQGVAFSALPFSGTTSLGQTSQSQSLVQSWNRLNIGPSYSVAVSRRFALGLSLHGVYSTESYILDSSAISTSVKNGGVQSSLGTSGGGNSFDLSAILGAIYSAAPYTFGLSLTFPAVHVMGSYTGTTHNEYETGTTGTASISNGSGSFSATPPIRAAIGAGVNWPRLTLEVDESLNIPSPSGFRADVSGTTTTLANNAVTTIPFGATYRIDEHAVLNTSVGAEYFLKKDFSLVGGFSFNLSALPPLNPSAGVGTLTQERESTATFSGGVGTYSKSGNLLLGFQFGYGWGSSLAVNPYTTPNELAVIDTRSYTALLILSGSTSLKSLGHAVERIESVISGDPMPKSTDAPPTPEKSDKPDKSAKPEKADKPEKAPLPKAERPEKLTAVKPDRPPPAKPAPEPAKPSPTTEPAKPPTPSPPEQSPRPALEPTNPPPAPPPPPMPSGTS